MSPTMFQQEIWFEEFWILEQNNLANSESLCRSDDFHQVLAQSTVWFGRRCCLNNYKMAIVVTILDIRMELF